MEPHSAVANNKLQFGVTSAQHGRETGGFFFAATAFTWLFVMTMAAHFFQSAFAVDFLLQTTQGFVYGLAFF